MSKDLIFTKTRNVKNPYRANPTDAGIDFFIPEYSEEFANEIIDKSMSKISITETSIIMKPGDNILIPLGIKVIVKDGESLVAFNKSGIGAKKGLGHIAEVIDRCYEGEVHLNMINLSNEVQEIGFGQKAIQFIQLKISQDQPKEVSNQDYYDLCKIEHTQSERGEGGFGSTSIDK